MRGPLGSSGVGGEEEDEEEIEGLGLGFWVVFLEDKLRLPMKAKDGTAGTGFGGLENQLSPNQPRFMDAIDGENGGRRRSKRIRETD